MRLSRRLRTPRCKTIGVNTVLTEHSIEASPCRRTLLSCPRSVSAIKGRSESRPPLRAAPPGHRSKLCGADFGAVVETGVPTPAALRSEIHEVPDGSEQIDASLFDVWGHPRMRSIEMAQGPVGIAGEHRNGGVLMPLAVLAAKVVLESAAAGAKEAQPLPAARSSVCAQSWDISGGDDGEV